MKLLIISGPTATGKTSLAVKLAKRFNGELISADSRQIYRGMDIGTGKDHPADIKIHLIDIINPDQEFSAAEYRQLAQAKIAEITAKNKLPILVGGTGFYIDALINPRPTFSVKPNFLLRLILNKFPLKLLQVTLRLLDFNTFRLLNHSDVSNPHRLIRKIEIKLSSKLQITDYQLPITKFLHLSLTAPIDYLIPRIDLRIQRRLDNGLLEEIKNLLTKYKWSDPGLNCLAYKEFQNPNFNQAQKAWQIHEHQYARRQKTWFKKITPITFIDITKKNYQKSLINQIDKWYNNL